MSATFIERVIRVGDFDNDGGIIDMEALADFLILYEADALGITADFLESEFSLTSPQRDQLDDILATRPSALLTALNATSRARWAHRVSSVLRCGVRQSTLCDTNAKCAALIGI